MVVILDIMHIFMDWCTGLFPQGNIYGEILGGLIWAVVTVILVPSFLFTLIASPVLYIRDAVYKKLGIEIVDKNKEYWEFFYTDEDKENDEDDKEVVEIDKENLEGNFTTSTTEKFEHEKIKKSSKSSTYTTEKTEDKNKVESVKDSTIVEKKKEPTKIVEKLSINKVEKPNVEKEDTRLKPNDVKTSIKKELNSDIMQVTQPKAKLKLTVIEEPPTEEPKISTRQPQKQEISSMTPNSVKIITPRMLKQPKVEVVQEETRKIKRRGFKVEQNMSVIYEEY